jgi:hypothetical protein
MTALSSDARLVWLAQRVCTAFGVNEDCFYKLGDDAQNTELLKAFLGAGEADCG